MPTPATPARRKVILANEAAIALLTPEADPQKAHVIVAGRSLVALTLAQLALPGARVIWADFRQSASVGRLHAGLYRLGGLDRLILAGDGQRADDIFSIIRAILCFLPALRRVGQARISLSVQDGPALVSLQEFLSRLSPCLGDWGVCVDLAIHPRARGAAVAAVGQA